MALGACYTFAFRALFAGDDQSKVELARTLFSRWPRSRDAEFMHHAFYCGPRYTLEDIEAALINDNATRTNASGNGDGDGESDDQETWIRSSWSNLEGGRACGRLLGCRGAGAAGLSLRGVLSTPEAFEASADLLAFLISKSGAVCGLFQGRAETGPRALGHRTILANACNPRSLEVLNARVKMRERVRPLAPMMTASAARALFHLAPSVAEGEGDDDGAGDESDDDNDGLSAYNFMVTAARARNGTRELIPAVVHADGTARLQIVRKKHDPFTFAVLKVCIPLPRPSPSPCPSPSPSPCPCPCPPPAPATLRSLTAASASASNTRP